MLTTLNRVGIALNFVAGLLLAPHLIGEERLEVAASWVGNTLRERLIRFIEPPEVTEGRRQAVERELARRRRAGKPAPTPSELREWNQGASSSPISAWQFLALTPVWIAAVLAVQWLSAGRITFDDDWWPSVLLLMSVGVVGGAAVLVVASVLTVAEAGFRESRDPTGALFVAAALAFPLVAALVFLGLALNFPAWLVHATRHRRWLITAMTSVGVAAFTVGNVLQFLATYDD